MVIFEKEKQKKHHIIFFFRFKAFVFFSKDTTVIIRYLEETLDNILVGFGQHRESFLVGEEEGSGNYQSLHMGKK